GRERSETADTFDRIRSRSARRAHDLLRLLPTRCAIERLGVSAALRHSIACRLRLVPERRARGGAVRAGRVSVCPELERGLMRDVAGRVLSLRREVRAFCQQT